MVVIECKTTQTVICSWDKVWAIYLWKRHTWELTPSVYLKRVDFHYRTQVYAVDLLKKFHKLQKKIKKKNMRNEVSKDR